eukprot:scaffold12214_cov83-Skeletonema_dohrnii-CCMP3373.AAC.1
MVATFERAQVSQFSFLAIIKSIANTITNMTYSPSAASTSPTGLQLLLAATMILTPKTKSTSTQSLITPVPYAPKKDRSAKSCAAVAPCISQLTFDVGGGDKPSWLRLNHRLNPKLRANASSDTEKLRNGNKRKVEESQSLWTHNKHPLQQKCINNKKQKSEDFTLSHALCKRFEKDTSSSENN